MTFPAKKLEVIEVQSDLRMLDRDRINLDLVVNDRTWSIDPASETILTKIMHPCRIFVPASLPCL